MFISGVVRLPSWLSLLGLCCTFAVALVGCFRDFPDAHGSLDASMDPSTADGGMPGDGASPADGAGPAEDGAVGPAPSYATIGLSLGAKRVELVRGRSVELAVSLLRGKGEQTQVTVTLEDLPSGVVVKPLTIAADAHEGKLVLEAKASAKLAVLTRVSVRAKHNIHDAHAEFELYVRGVPGTLDETFGQEGILGVPSGDSTWPFEDAVSLKVLDDDRMLVACNTITENIASHQNIQVLRITAQGAIDKDFGVDGKYDFAKANAPDAPMAAVKSMSLVEHGTRVWLGGESYGTENSGSLLLTLTLGGKNAPEFKPAYLGGTQKWDGIAQNNALPPVTVAIGNQVEGPGIARIGYNGTLTDLHDLGGVLAALRFVAADPVSHRFVIGGNCDGKACLLLLNQYGDTPTSVPVYHGFESGSLADGTFDEQGRAYAVGSNGSGWLLARYVPEALSASHADEFYSVVDGLGPLNGAEATSMVLSGNMLYVAGTKYDVETSTTHALVGRYSLEGKRDPTFAAAGLLTFAAELGAAGVHVAAQSDGRIVAALVNKAGDLLIYRVWD